ncbi:MAG: hypothetical protein WC548_00020 [Candidatus Pacearchaeota archaeon]
MDLKRFDKRGQVTIFIILAIVIVGSIIVYFLLGDEFENDIPSDFIPVYDYYVSCIEDIAKGGIALMGEQGGYIEKPDFIKGSSYMPFSSQLDFLGQGIPYWMYISGNNILREQVPVKQDMEEQLNEYVSERIGFCDFSDFEMRGYDVYLSDSDVKTKINDMNVVLEINSPLSIYFGNQSVVVENHEISLESKLGKYYKLALEIYNHEKKNVFLESYALDVMRLYAPVSGVEISCVPKIFVDENIREDIAYGLSLNIPSLKLNGDYYELSSRERNYFVEEAGIDVDENVNFFYSSDWPTRIEIYGDRVANPVGLQEGMGMLGFCYVPYQLIYDINFPVLVQIYDNEELFQFPVAVVISKNQARQSMNNIDGASIESPVCEFKNQDVKVFSYDLDLNPVESRIQFKCLNSICEIGETKILDNDAVLDGDFPQCVNGFVIASAEGYADTKVMLSTNEDDLVNIIMRKKYNLSLDLGNIEKALVSFDSEEYSTTVLYPDVKSIELIEAYYNVSVYAYDNSSLKLPAMNERKCVSVPESGLAGLFGAEAEKCFDINIPETDISFAVVGGGQTQEYFTEVQLRDSEELNINIPLFSLPKNLDELQQNQIAATEETVYLTLE